jgi:predicted RNase H-like nuclease (RuvC/YqgF family)
MTSEYDELVISLKDKIFRLILLFEEEKKKNEVLLKDIELLKTQYEKKTKEVEELNQKYESLKLGKMIEISGGDVHDARIKINRIVREVDQCIALLNK